MTDSEKKRTEEEIRALRAAINSFERDNPGHPEIERLKNRLRGLEAYLRGF